MDLDQFTGRRRARARAAHLQMRRAHVMSHDSAGDELGLAMLAPEKEYIHVTRKGVRGGRVEHGVKHHLAPYADSQVVLVDGIPVLGIARTALDIAREHGLVPGVVAIDSARQLGASASDLWAAAAPMVCWPEVTVVRAAIEKSDPGAESVGETLGRLLLEEIGLGPVQTQFELRDQTGWARCDMRVGRHVVEFDGAKKYHRRDKGGLAVVDPDQVVWQEKQRQDWVTGFRLGMSRLVWADYWGRRRRARQGTHRPRVRRHVCGVRHGHLRPLALHRPALGLTSATCNAVFGGPPQRYNAWVSRLEHRVTSGLGPRPAGAAQRKTTVRSSLRSTRVWECQRTARERTWASTSWPAVTSWSAE